MSTNRIAIPGAFLAAAALALTTAAQPASAKPQNGASVHVFYGDVNLNSKAGAQVVLRRIKSAADKACGGAPILTALTRYRTYQDCMQAATDRAVRELNAPLLNSLQARSKAYARAARPRPQTR